jgi:hypothetical protein
MKRILAALAFLAASLHAQTATVTLPVATPLIPVVSWTLPTAGTWGSCTAIADVTCTFQVYAIPGSCPATLPGSTGWTTLPISAANAVSEADTTETPGTTVSYVVFTEYGGVQSTNSNCVTVTIPLNPPAPVITAKG